MCDSKVETISRMAQWRMENLASSTYKRSEPFKIGIWHWHLSVEKNEKKFYIRLFPVHCQTSKEQPPAAKFILRLTAPSTNRPPIVSPVYERVCDNFFWRVESNNAKGYSVIEVEFHDLKIAQETSAGIGSSIWPSQHRMATQTSLPCLSRMILESIYADVTIITSDGSLQAHMAILSASSPVFHSIILLNLKEKHSSTIDLRDMSTNSCMALLGCLYGTIKPHDFRKHRSALLAAAHMYDISDLKDYCEESLIEDINTGNVIERLQEAWIYQLHKLKKVCFKYLFYFGKIVDVKEEMTNYFFTQADRELKQEIFQQILQVWAPAT